MKRGSQLRDAAKDKIVHHNRFTRKQYRSESKGINPDYSKFH